LAAWYVFKYFIEAMTESDDDDEEEQECTDESRCEECTHCLRTRVCDMCECVGGCYEECPYLREDE